MKLAARSLTRNSSAPSSSSLRPKRPMGVAARIFCVRAVGVPSWLTKRSAPTYAALMSLMYLVERRCAGSMPGWNT